MDPTAIALLIDADNCPAAKITVILDELSKFGVVNIRRAYGDWKASALGSWADILHDYAIQPVQQFAYTKGRSATDSAIIIDAMDLLYTQKLSAFGIASSDSDFTPLAMRLRANGLRVFVFGEAKTPNLSSMRARSFSSSKTSVPRCKLRVGAPKRHKPCRKRNRPMNCAGTRAWLPTSAAPSTQFPMKRVGRRSVTAISPINGQQVLAFVEADRKAGKGITGYEYAVLVTNTDHEVLSLGQLYRDRADAEKAFDELKNQWGWGGFTTHDLHRCQLAARGVALAYNWWSLFVRLAHPDARREAITSRPWLMSSVGRRTEHAGQTTITLTGLHAHFDKARAMLLRVSTMLQGWVAQAAEPLRPVTIWQRVCDHLTQIIAGVGPPKSLRLLGIIQTESGNYGF